MGTFCSIEEYKNRKEVVEAHYDAEVIKKCDGGWMVFDTTEDYKTWKNQK